LWHSVEKTRCVFRWWAICATLNCVALAGMSSASGQTGRRGSLNGRGPPVCAGGVWLPGSRGGRPAASGGGGDCTAGCAAASARARAAASDCTTASSARADASSCSSATFFARVTPNAWVVASDSESRFWRSAFVSSSSPSTVCSLAHHTDTSLRRADALAFDALSLASRSDLARRASATCDFICTASCDRTCSAVFFCPSAAALSCWTSCSKDTLARSQLLSARASSCSFSCP
jgi:hypothetical protein